VTTNEKGSVAEAKAGGKKQPTDGAASAVAGGKGRAAKGGEEDEGYQPCNLQPKPCTLDKA